MDFLKLDLNTPSGISAYRLDNILYGTPLQGLGKAFVAAEQKYHMHAIYLLAHAIHESNFGRSQIAQRKYNLFGFMAYDNSPMASAMQFDSFAHSIDYCAGYIKRHYLTPGGKWYNGPTLPGMNVRYATDKNWANAIAKWMSKLYSQLGDRDYKGHWAEKQIQEVLDKGLMHGYEDGTFRPDTPCTRAELAVTILAILKGKGGM